ncbi:MAG TPA: endolytic transglycosylase MltG [Solirubrobacterales bacterium]
MSEDWLSDDAFADPDDPAAREREQRRLEREERRQAREEKRKPQAAPPSSPAPPTEPPEPAAPTEPPPPRTPEEEFWDEDPAAHEPAPERPVRPEPALDHPAVAAEPRAAAMAASTRRGRRGAGGPGGGGGGGGKRGDVGVVLGKFGRHPFRIAGIVVALLALWFLYALFQPFHGDGSGKVQLTIPKGSSVSEVADLLGEKGVIDNSTLFQVRVTLEGKRSDLYAGHFTLAHGMSYGAAIDALSTPPVKRTTTVTIPEGYTRSQAAQLVEEDGVPGSYTKATVKSKYLNPADYGAKNARDLEGFLFPDTFEMKPNAPVADLVQLQLQDFEQRIEGVDMSYARSKNLTVYDVLIIASMIEREAGVPGQRKLVASVIYNRLHEGMTLGIDATIRFATGNYAKPLTESELAIDSPYNTRTNTGLPPGPIDSPGLASIEAAAHPAKTGYLFYVTKPGACGKLAFSKTEAEFEKSVELYESAREAAGGNSPDTCGE